MSDDTPNRPTLEDLEAKWMADPEFRAAAEAAEPLYQCQRENVRLRALLKRWYELFRKGGVDYTLVRDTLKELGQ